MGPTVTADPHRDAVETSVSASVSDVVSLSTFRTSVETLLKQWPTVWPGGKVLGW